MHFAFYYVYFMQNDIPAISGKFVLFQSLRDVIKYQFSLLDCTLTVVGSQWLTETGFAATFAIERQNRLCCNIRNRKTKQALLQHSQQKDKIGFAATFAIEKQKYSNFTLHKTYQIK